MMDVVIVGSGGHGQVVADILLSGPSHNGLRIHPIGFVDDDLERQRCSFLGLPVLGTITQLPAIDHQAVIVAIGHNQIRRKIYQHLLAQGERFITAYHPSALIGKNVEIGRGTVINSGVIINTGAQIGQNVILNTACSIDHHNQIGAHVHIAPGVHLGGDVKIEEGVLVGIGATVMPQRRIGAWSIIGAGAVVTKDVPAYTTVAGIPARIIKANQV